MNHVYRLIWREAAGGFVAVAEMARAGGARTSRASRKARQAAVAAAALVAVAGAQAGGTGFNVVDGSASVATSGATTTVTQSTQGVRIDWQSLGVAAGETLKFVQPNTSAVALNVIKGGSATEILGQLQGNGHVFIVNPNGVLVGSGAQVTVGGFLASTADVASFNSATGALVLTNNDSTKEVRNEGSIIATKGGMVALVGNKVINAGTIVVPGGGIYLLGGGRIEFKPGDGSPFTYTLTTDSTRAISVINNGTLSAAGGQIAMDARSSIQAVVNSSNVIEAGAVSTGPDGSIRLTALGGAGDVYASGTLNAGKSGTVTAELDAGGSLHYSSAKPQGSSELISNWVSAKDKTYDGTTAATLAFDLNALSPVEGLYVHVEEAAFASRHADTDVDVTVSLMGESTPGVKLDYPDTLVATITPKEIGTTVTTKTYDGTSTATVTYNADDILAIDKAGLKVGISNGAFEDRHAGEDKDVTYDWKLLGNGQTPGDYVLSGTATGTITPKEIGTTVTTKTYDGTSTATVTYNAGDILAIDKDGLKVSVSNGAFEDRHAGEDKDVTYDWKLLGNGQTPGDYVLAGTATGTITPKEIGTTVTSKTYDGTTTATVSYNTDDVLAIDKDALKVSISNANYDNKNAGTGKDVSYDWKLAGNGQTPGDYVLANSAKGAIDQASLTLSAVADTKVVDGTTTSTAAPQSSGLVGGDSIGGLSQSFAGSTVGSHLLNVNGGYTVNDGNGGKNYKVTLASAEGQITAVPTTPTTPTTPETPTTTPTTPDLNPVINNGGNQSTPINVDLAGLGDLLAQLPPTAAGEEEDPEKIKARRRSDRSPLRVTEGGVKAPQNLR